LSKRVAVIDLGSNSARLAIFERTSRLGFYILREFKAKVRLGKGAYGNGGIITNEAMNETLKVLGEFKKQLKTYKVSRIICGGTSALRDAPNKSEFVGRARRELGLNFSVISGKEEAFLGGIAALNLLDGITDGVSVDIGGGSTEFALIRGGRITKQLSLNIGTVRLKELFFDKNDFKGAVKFVEKELEMLDFTSENLIAIGGSLRAITTAVMKEQNYPFEILHNFKFGYKERKPLIKRIASAQVSELKGLGIKKERFDTVREGALICHLVAKKLHAKNVITSGVGVREGMFLKNLLRPAYKLPRGFSPSLRSLQDRFCKSPLGLVTKHCSELFSLLGEACKFEKTQLHPLLVASKLCNIGESIGVSGEAENAAFITKKALAFGFDHQKRLLVAKILESKGKKANLGAFEELLPSTKVVHALSFVLYVAKVLAHTEAGFSFSGGVLKVSGVAGSKVLTPLLEKLELPQGVEELAVV